MESYDIFLSHSSADKSLVRNIFNDIENENQTGNNFTAWFDEIDIGHGKSITGLVNSGLTKSIHFGIVMTPSYFNSASGWTDAEWHSALFDDPDNRSGRIIPILAMDCPNIPPLLKHLKYIDIRGKHYSKGLGQLIDKLSGKNLSRKRPTQLNSNFGHFSGSNIEQSEPDEIKERLTSNLLPVLDIPRRIYYGKIKETLLKVDGNEKKIPSKNELKELLYQIQLDRDAKSRPYMPAFRSFEDKIVTFYNLNDSSVLLNAIIEKGTVTSEETVDLIDNDDSLKIVVSLLNMSISRHLFRCGLVQDSDRQSRFYFPTDHGETNVIVWKSFKNRASRTVAKPVKSFDGYSLWLHQGATIKLLFLAKTFHLQVVPTWVLTINGTNPAGGKDVAKIVNKWTNAERNLSLVRHIKFWSSILSNGKSQISVYCGSSLIKIASNTTEAEMQYGIKDDQILLLDDSIEMTSVDDIIEGRLTDDIDTDMSELDDFSEDEDDDEDSYEEES